MLLGQGGWSLAVTGSALGWREAVPSLSLGGVVGRWQQALGFKGLLQG